MGRSTVFGKHVLDKEFSKVYGIQYLDRGDEDSLFHKIVNYY